MPVVSLLLVSPKLLLDETFVETDDPRLLKLPNGKLVEDGCVAAALRLNRLLELEVLARDTAMEVKAAFLLKTVPKTGVEVWGGPAAKMLEDVVHTGTSTLDPFFPNPKPKTLLVDGTTAEVVSPEKYKLIKSEMITKQEHVSLVQTCMHILFILYSLTLHV